MNVIEILEKLEQNTSGNAKIDILKENIDNELLKNIFIASLNPYIVYNIKKFTIPTPIDSENNDTRMDTFVNNILPKLSSREFTGHAAKDLVESEMSLLNESEQKWAKRILIKNLRAGTQTSTVNKVWKNLIPKFKVQLAYDLDTSHDNDKIIIKQKISYPVRLEPKLDGLRCIASKSNGTVSMYTRSGREIDTLPTIKRLLESSTLDNIILDGEAMGEDWNESSSIIASKKTHKNDDNMGFRIFDAMPIEDWNKQKCSLGLNQRNELVEKLVLDINDPHITMVEGKIVNNESELMEFYELCLSQNYEGIMIKSINGKYSFKRTKDMLKMKPEATYEGVVVSHYLGKDGSKNQGLFGGFNVLLPNGIITDVGGGFTEGMRATLSNNTDSHIGRIIEVKGQPPLTKDGKVRFPVFCRWREESDVDQSVIEAYENYKDISQ